MERIINLLRKNAEEKLSDRLLAQLNFARRLSAENDGKYDDIIREAVDFVAEASADGVVTEGVVCSAEEILAPVSEEAKSFRIICASHAHIDMNWLWGWDETVSVVIDTVTTMLKLLEEYPDFRYSLSQASTYKIIYDNAPGLFEKIKQYVHEGRWEVTAPSWVECDKNMPSGESLVRQLIEAKSWLSEKLEIPLDDINLDFEPDTFGHSRNVPEILRGAGVKYYYHCRGIDFPYSLYRWRAPSGAEVIVNRETNFYSSPVRSDWGLVALEMSKAHAGIKTTLRVYGVGDHGGGPSRRDIEKLREMNSWPCFPSFILGTYREFFTEIEKERDKLPIVDEELNFVLDGCYTAQSRIKQKNKQTENELYNAAALSAFAQISTVEPKFVKQESKQRFLTTHFHDIVTGSCRPDTRMFALGEYQNILADVLNTKKMNARSISENIDTMRFFSGEEEEDRAFGAGAGSWQYSFSGGMRRIFHVFNTELGETEKVIKLTLWDWQGDKSRLIVTDSRGEELEHQVLEDGFSHYWGHSFITVLVYARISAGGYTTIICDEGAYDGTKAVYWPEKRQQRPEEFVLENEFLRAEFNRMNGKLVKVCDKVSGKLYEGLDEGGFALVTEACRKEISHWGSEMSAWIVGRYKEIEDIQKNCELTSYHGPLRSGITCEFSFGERSESKVKFEAYLDKGSRLIRYRTNVRWLETGSHEKGVPQLSFRTPLGETSDDKFRFDVPFGTMDRPGMHQDMPGLTYAEKSGISIMSADTYGYRCNGDTIALTVLRGSFEPDPFPEYGDHEMQFAVGFGCGEEKDSFMNEPYAVSAYAHEGSLPADASLISLNGAGMKISSLEAADGGIVLRVYNSGDSACEAGAAIGRSISSAALTDYFGRETGEVKLSGDSVSFTAQPHTIYTVRIDF